MGSNRRAQQAPSIVQPISTQPNQNTSHSPASENAPQPLIVRELPPVPVKNWLDKTYIFLTGILALVGIFGVRAAYRTLRAIEQQAGVMKAQRKTMQRQLGTMRGPLSQMESTGRQTDELIKHAAASVELRLPRNHPTGLPVVRETGGRIPRCDDRHINTADGTACVLIPDERWRLWPVGAPLLSFLTGPLHSFFLAQSMVDEGEPWPFGQWAHGPQGVFQYYRELLKTSDLRVITTYLDYLSAKKVKGHWACACGSGKKLRDCHFGQIKDLREKISLSIFLIRLAASRFETGKMKFSGVHGMNGLTRMTLLARLPKSESLF
jgi:hypothetical protein